MKKRKPRGKEGQKREKIFIQSTYFLNVTSTLKKIFSNTELRGQILFYFMNLYCYCMMNSKSKLTPWVRILTPAFFDTDPM